MKCTFRYLWASMSFALFYALFCFVLLCPASTVRQLFLHATYQTLIVICTYIWMCIQCVQFAEAQLSHCICTPSMCSWAFHFCFCLLVSFYRFVQSCYPFGVSIPRKAIFCRFLIKPWYDFYRCELASWYEAFCCWQWIFNEIGI